MRMATWLIGSFATSVALAAMADLPNDPTQVQPLSVATWAPAFAAQTVDGKIRTCSPDSYRRPTVVIFYRGGWCPYRNTQLSDLRTVEPRLRARGFEIVFLSTDQPRLLYSSLMATAIHYMLLSDSHLEAARAFHVAYHVSDATLAKMREYGVDLNVGTGTTLHQLPVPSNPDYKVRLGADALWAAAEPLFATWATAP